MADLRDFIYLQPKTLKKLATAAAPDGTDQAREARAQADRYDFQRFRAGVSYDRYQIGLEDGRLAGDLLGMTMDGRVDLARQRVDLTGTFVPLYGVNSLVSGIPILGWLLAGGEGQGIFAVTYTIRGPLRDPDTAVNPLSVLAPGFLRNLLFLEKAEKP